MRASASLSGRAKLSLEDLIIFSLAIPGELTELAQETSGFRLRLASACGSFSQRTLSNGRFTSYANSFDGSSRNRDGWIEDSESQFPLGSVVIELDIASRGLRLGRKL
jgi:hypothetical protein